MKKIAVAGHLCLDMIPEIDHHFDMIPGRLYEIGPAKMATGGAVSNTGVACHILGLPTTLVGKVGQDDFGQVVLDVLRNYGEELVEGMVVAPDAVTSYTVVINIPGIDRTFLHCCGANHEFDSRDVNPAAFSDAALFHFGYPPIMGRTYANQGDELVKIFESVKSAGMTTSLDMVMPDPDGPSGKADWETILTRTLPSVDIFIPSADELLYMIDRDKFGEGDNLTGDEVSAISSRLLDMGVAIAGLKLGSRGLYIRTAGEDRLAAMGAGAPEDVAAWAGRELWFPVFEIPQFVGATGAGDTTIAGFLTAYLRGMTPVECGRMANAVGSCNVQAPDALSGIKSWDETKAMLDAGWAHEPLQITGQGWCEDVATGVWHGPNSKQ
jgi:sugar/nucleoside kinase (ribokinase family)